jgi:hypothetical protein
VLTLGERQPMVDLFIEETEKVIDEMRGEGRAAVAVGQNC